MAVAAGFFVYGGDELRGGRVCTIRPLPAGTGDIRQPGT